MVGGVCVGTGHQVSAGCVWPSPLGCVSVMGSEVRGWDHDLEGPSRLWAQPGVKDMGRDEVGGNGGPSAPRKSLPSVVCTSCPGAMERLEEALWPPPLPSSHPCTLWGRVGSPHPSVGVSSPFPSLSLPRHLSVSISLLSSPHLSASISLHLCLHLLPLLPSLFSH